MHYHSVVFLFLFSLFGVEGRWLHKRLCNFPAQQLPGISRALVYIIPGVINLGVSGTQVYIIPEVINSGISGTQVYCILYLG